ncbi:hypothetical protein GSI_10635 [Ganoderma sinense ZZ0214-1]|uniref:DUF6534 domain-containing protein n=1 Tax=Ganoderma sinense ZZ0214-1 TaxID=1077348 RepID=A0A2G8S154_9APHY|nr:hypothetical protein GSI_10635 [Ganoderma sinense ZZ0214-1]
MAIVISSLTVFSGSIVFAVKGFMIPSFTQLYKISDILYWSLGSGVVADVLIAGSMCVLLAKRRTGFTSINTGALTSLCALLTLLTYASMPDNFVFMAFYFVLPKRVSASEPNLPGTFARASCPRVLDSVLELVAGNAQCAATAPGDEFGRRHGLDSPLKHK